MASINFNRAYLIFVFYFVLTIGCFWQILNVCQLYFEYPTNVFIETKIDSLKYSLPAITFCGDTINKSFDKNSTEILQNEFGQFKYQMFNGYIKLKGAGIGKGWGIFKNESYDLFYTIERISLERYCITLNSILSGLKSTELNNNEKLEIQFENNTKFLKKQKWLLYLHDSYSMPFSREWNYIEVLGAHYHAITWKVLSYKLLESPYPTNCKNYRLSTKYLSHKDCILKCKLEVSLTNCGVIYEGIDIQNGEPSARFGKKGGSNCVKDLDSVCSKRCPNYDCDINHYTPVLLMKSPRTKPNNTMINLLPPTEPVIIYTHEPRIQIIELLCNIGSTISLWFGFSFYSFYYLFSVCHNHLSDLAYKPDITINKSKQIGLKEERSVAIIGHQLPNKNRLYFKLIFYILLKIGCFWQILNVCQLYFEYPTNVFIETKFDSLKYSLPAITFCGVTKDKSFGKNSSEIFQNEFGDFKYKMFAEISLKGPGNRSQNLKDNYLANAIERVGLHQYSITLNSLVSGSSQTTLYLNDVIKINITGFTKWSEWAMYLHDSYNMPVNGEWTSIPVKKGHNQTVSWRVESYNLLEHPYRTNCKNYRLTKEYLSRKDCIRKCSLNVSLTKCEAIYMDIDIRKDEPSVRFGKKDELEKCLKDININSICAERCPNYDCDIDYYTPVVLNRVKRDDYLTLVDLVIPNDPETIFNHLPRIQAIELFCYIGSTISMWFGLSLYSLNYLFYILNNLANKSEIIPKGSPVQVHKTKRLAHNKLRW